MLLNSLFLAGMLFFSNIYLVLITLILFIILTLILKKRVLFPEKRYYLHLLLTAVIIQIFYNQEGKVVYSAGVLILTKSGIISGAASAVKIYGMMIISKNTDFKKIFNGRFKKQAFIFEIVIKIVPEILKMPKTMINPGKTVKYILKRVYRELRKESN